MTQQLTHTPREIPARFDEIISSTLASSRSEMKLLFEQIMAEKSISGQEKSLVDLIASWADKNGFFTDLWQCQESSLSEHPQGQSRHIPLNNRPTLVIGLSSTTIGPTLIFNAHSDVVDAPDPKQWTFNPWSATTRADRIYGRGACDVKGPLISALWAMRSVRKHIGTHSAGRVLLELVPGEEDAVGLGTLTSVLRGYRADASIILEPTEGLPRCASRPGMRFYITVLGKAVHGTVKWLGQDAIVAMRQVLLALEALEQEFDRISPDPLFREYPIGRPITVDFVNAGRCQGMIADQAGCAGYFELLPGDSQDYWRNKFCDGLKHKLNFQGISSDRLSFEFTESYDGHSSPTDSAICRIAEKLVSDPSNDIKWTGWKAFNSGCEAGLRANLHHTPTLVWGPGSLAQAHSVDEYVDFREVERVAKLFIQMIAVWLELR